MTGNRHKKHKGELGQVVSQAKAYLEENWRRILDLLTEQLLPMHNEDWQDEDDPPLGKADFLSALGTPDVNLWEEDAIMLLFPDGGLFSGHYLEVFVDGPAYGRKTSVQIVG